MKPAPWVFLVVMLGLNLLNYIDRYILSSNLTDVGRELIEVRPSLAEWEKTLKGALGSAFMVAFMVSAPIFGWLSGRVSRTKMIGIGALTWSLACGLGGMSGHVERWAVNSPLLSWAAKDDAGLGALLGGFGFLLLTRCFVGVGEGAYGPAAPAILSDIYGEKERGWVIGLFYLAIPIGGAMGYLIGGWLGWPDSFFWVVPPGIVFAIWCWCLTDPLPAGAKAPAQGDISGPKDGKDSLLGEYLSLLARRTYFRNVMAYTLSTFVIGGIAHWLPDYVVDYRAAATKEKSGLMIGGITAGAGLLATFCGTWLAEWLAGKIRGSHMVVCGVGMILGFPALIAVTLTPFPLAWIFVFIAIFGFFLNTGPSNTVLLSVVPARLRAPAMALCILVIHALGDVISPTIIGLISDTFPGGLNTAFQTISVLAFFSGLVWLSAAPTLQADIDQAKRENG